MITVKLKELCDAIECSGDLIESIIEKKSGEIYFIDDETRLYAESGGDFPDWLEENIQIAREHIKNPENFVEVPSQREVNEYSMMENFSISLSDDKQTEKLLTAMRGKNAFRRFKDCVITLGIETAWYNYKDQQYREFVREWAEENSIDLI